MPMTTSISADERGVLTACPECGQRARLNYGQLSKTFRCAKCQTELPAVNRPIVISSEAIFASLTTQSALPVLVDFWADWCGPCKMVAPELDKIAQEGANQWLVAKVNTEELPGLAQRFRISALPTMAIFQDGNEIARKAGAMQAPAIRQFIQQATMVQGKV
jgi:thioredoxin 2